MPRSFGAFPSNSTWPLESSTGPSCARSFKNTVFPTPLGPFTNTFSPFSAWKEMFSSRTCVPIRHESSFTWKKGFPRCLSPWPFVPSPACCLTSGRVMHAPVDAQSSAIGVPSRTPLRRRLDKSVTNGSAATRKTFSQARPHAFSSAGHDRVHGSEPHRHSNRRRERGAMRRGRPPRDRYLEGRYRCEDRDLPPKGPDLRGGRTFVRETCWRWSECHRPSAHAQRESFVGTKQHFSSSPVFFHSFGHIQLAHVDGHGWWVAAPKATCRRRKQPMRSTSMSIIRHTDSRRLFLASCAALHLPFPRNGSSSHLATTSPHVVVHTIRFRFQSVRSGSLSNRSFLSFRNGSRPRPWTRHPSVRLSANPLRVRALAKHGDVRDTRASARHDGDTCGAPASDQGGSEVLRTRGGAGEGSPGTAG